MNIVDMLDGLIAISIEKHYRYAAKDLERASLEAFLEWQALNRKAAADNLSANAGKLKAAQPSTVR